jgi:hypothetical protein
MRAAVSSPVARCSSADELKASGSALHLLADIGYAAV